MRTSQIARVARSVCALHASSTAMGSLCTLQDFCATASDSSDISEHLQLLLRSNYQSALPGQIVVAEACTQCRHSHNKHSCALSTPGVAQVAARGCCCNVRCAACASCYHKNKDLQTSQALSCEASVPKPFESAAVRAAVARAGASAKGR